MYDIKLTSILNIQNRQSDDAAIAGLYRIILSYGNGPFACNFAIAVVRGLNGIFLLFHILLGTILLGRSGIDRKNECPSKTSTR